MIQVISAIESIKNCAEDPVISRFSHKTPALAGKSDWAWSILANQSRSLHSFLSVGTWYEQILHTYLCLMRGVTPGRLVCVINKKLESIRKDITIACEGHSTPTPVILCGDLEHQATMFQAQEFGLYDIVRIGESTTYPEMLNRIDLYAPLVKPDGFLVNPIQDRNSYIIDHFDTDYEVGQLAIRRRVK